jgi:hypothetical protein
MGPEMIEQRRGLDQGSDGVALVMVPGAATLLRVPLRERDSAADEAMHNG